MLISVLEKHKMQPRECWLKAPVAFGLPGVVGVSRCPWQQF